MGLILYLWLAWNFLSRSGWPQRSACLYFLGLCLYLYAFASLCLLGHFSKIVSSLIDVYKYIFSKTVCYGELEGHRIICRNQTKLIRFGNKWLSPDTVFFKNSLTAELWWHMPLRTALGRQRQMGFCEFWIQG